MKRATLDATDLNVLESIKADTYGRNRDVKDFIESLDNIDGNMFISLDAKWGEGKTFFVRQVEKSLNFLTKLQFDSGNQIIADEMDYFKKTPIMNVELEKSYVPIYYDAWLYDNHQDPLMSLMFVIAKRYATHVDTKLSKGLGERVKSLFSSFSFANAAAGGQISFMGQAIDAITPGEDIFKNIKTAEEIKALVKGILEEAAVEKGQKVVVFIDELDRCRPTYAIEILERIKHYFDDERIIFVVSLNKEQLIHTISNYYGKGFDSTAYLNKFFDLNTHLPSLKPAQRKQNMITEYIADWRAFVEVANALNDFHSLTIRDSMLYKQRINSVVCNHIDDITLTGCCLSLFIPLLIILDITDQENKQKFLQGDSTVLEYYLRNVNTMSNIVDRFSGYENLFDVGLNKIIDVYEYTFKLDRKTIDSRIADNIDRELKNICIRACNF